MGIKGKLSSRKLWLAVAAFLASLGTGLAGLADGNQSLAITGAVMCVLSAAIYAAAEAYVDAASAKANGTQTVKSVTAEATDKATVAAALGADGQKDDQKEA